MGSWIKFRIIERDKWKTDSGSKFHFEPIIDTKLSFVRKIKDQSETLIKKSRNIFSFNTLYRMTKVDGMK